MLLFRTIIYELGFFPNTEFYSKIFHSLCLPALTRYMNMGWREKNMREVGSSPYGGPHWLSWDCCELQEHNSHGSLHSTAELGLFPAWITIIIWGHPDSLNIASDRIPFLFSLLIQYRQFYPPQSIKPSCSLWHTLSYFRLCRCNCAFYSFL